MGKRLKWGIPLVLAALMAGGFAAYVGQYYHAEPAALEALRSDDAVQVSRTDYGWLFDGPSDDRALIFYPGAKVEETAYAPLLRRLAAGGMDACLVGMPARLALFGIDRAEAVMRAHDYPYWYVGGHSLGGVCAAFYAAGHADRLKGIALLAAYPAKALSDDLAAVSVYGSEDGVLNLAKYREGMRNAPADTAEYVIEGGNHAGFGAYGPQKGDGAAAISAEAQVDEAVRDILEGLTREAE